MDQTFYELDRRLLWSLVSGVTARKRCNARFSDSRVTNEHNLYTMSSSWQSSQTTHFEQKVVVLVVFRHDEKKGMNRWGVLQIIEG